MARILQGVQNIITAMKDGSVEARIGSPQGGLSKTESTLTIVAVNTRMHANALIVRRGIAGAGWMGL